MAGGAKVVAEQESVHRNDEDEYHAEQSIRYKQGLAARLDGFFSVEWQLRLGFGHARNSIPPFLASAKKQGAGTVPLLPSPAVLDETRAIGAVSQRQGDSTMSLRYV